MMEGGENIKVVSEILGHSSVAITGDIYVHTTSDSKRAAMASMAKIIGL
jgi:integrase